MSASSGRNMRFFRGKHNPLGLRANQRRLLEEYTFYLSFLFCYMREAVVRERSFWEYYKCCSVRGVHCRPEMETDSDRIPYTHANMDTLHTLLTSYLSHILKGYLAQNKW